jgi:adenosylcobinamide-phosphate synthase
MTFFAVLFALVIEQFRALSHDNPVHEMVRGLARRSERAFDAGSQRDAIFAWCAVVLPLTLGAWVIDAMLASAGFALSFLWNVLLLYLTLGFRQFSHFFTDIHDALNRDDVIAARALLREWTGLDTVDMPVREVCRYTLEHAIIAVHRHVFGVFFWFLLPIGPAGVVLYRVAEYLARHWSLPTAQHSPALGAFAARAFYILDWLPARLTSIGFAIVGNFEDAIYAWRNHARRWNDAINGVLLASGGGALGVRLGIPPAEPDAQRVLGNDFGTDFDAEPVFEAQPQEFSQEPTARTLQSAVGLVWRAVVLWMVLLAMLSLAIWLG